MTPEAASGAREVSEREKLRALRRNARSYANALTKTRRLTEASQEFEDTMLTWSIGLMGAGLFALPKFLSDACGTTKHSLLAIASPWALGILLALVGRIVGTWHREADALRFAGKWGGIQGLLVGLPRSSDDFGKQLLAYLNDTTEQLSKLTRKSRRTNWWAVRLLYATLIAFAVGMVTVFWSIRRC